jgi:hypothetical protein
MSAQQQQQRLLGVTLDSRRGKYKARVHYANKERYLGRCVCFARACVSKGGGGGV